MAARRLAFLLAVALLGLAAVAKETARYEFEDVRAAYGLAFVADPPADGNATWMTELAGGPGQPLNVTYGFVELLQDGTWHRSEPFVRLSGPGGSKAYLLNSCTWRQADGGLQAKGDYSWHKRIENSSLVKDFSPPASAVLFVRDQDAAGNLTGLRFQPFAGIANPDATEAERQDFWLGPAPTEGMWTARMDSLTEAGVRPDWRGIC